MRRIYASLPLFLACLLVAPTMAVAASSPAAEAPHGVGRHTSEASPTPPAVAAVYRISDSTHVPEAPTIGGSIGPMLRAQGPFGDLDEQDDHFASIRALAELGVFDRTLCSTGFCPHDPIDRKTSAVWLVRVLDGVDPSPRVSRYVDVVDNPWWEPHVERLAELEITFGCKTDPLQFCPLRHLTRAEAASFLVRAFNLEPGPAAGFTDINRADTHYSSINSLAASRITVGCGDGTRFCPNSHTTRAQMAALLHRAMTSQRIDSTSPDTGTTLTESYIRWPDLWSTSPYLESLAPIRMDLDHEFIKTDIRYQIEMPVILKDQNEKLSMVYTAVNSSSWQGRHQYACGVKGKFSTKAQYDFGTIDRPGTYEIYAYFPGYSASYWYNNDGYGSYTSHMNGTIARQWEESQQYGGWQRIRFGDWGLRRYEGRVSTATQALEVGDTLVVEIHNGDHQDEGGCAPNTTVVFPPMLLVRVEDVKRLKPFSPAHDLHPWTAIFFNACLNEPEDVDIWLESGDLFEQFSGLEIGIGSLNRLGNYQEDIVRLFHCESLLFDACESFLYFGYWTPPNTTLNHSNVSLEPQYLTCLSRSPDEGPEIDLSDGVLWTKWR